MIKSWYYCHACKKFMLREDTAQRHRSYCETKQRFVNMRKTSEEKTSYGKLESKPRQPKRGRKEFLKEVL